MPREYKCINRSGYDIYRDWTVTGCQNRHGNINLYGRETCDFLGKDGRTNFTLSNRHYA